MVETRPRGTAQARTFPRENASGFQEPRTRRSDLRPKAAAPSNTDRRRIRRRMVAGESWTIATLVTSSGILCAIFMVYLVAWAQVLIAGNEVRHLQMTLDAEQARHDDLTKEVAHLQSGTRIAGLAAKMNMVLDTENNYVVVKSAPTAAGVDQNGGGSPIEVASAN